MTKLIIFDFDGVILDSEPLHFAKFRDVLVEWGEDFTWDEYVGKYLALNDRDCFEAVLGDRGWATQKTVSAASPEKTLTEAVLKKMCSRKEELFKRDLTTGLRPVKGSLEFIRRASRSYLLAIASGSLHSEILEALEPHGVIELFETIVGADDVLRGKPYPDPYLKALELVKLKRGADILSAECVVIEDSIVGVEAALLAGMRCVALTTSYPRERLERADLVIDTLENLTLPLDLPEDGEKFTS